MKRYIQKLSLILLICGVGCMHQHKCPINAVAFESKLDQLCENHKWQIESREVNFIKGEPQYNDQNISQHFFYIILVGASHVKLTVIANNGSVTSYSSSLING